MFTGKITVEFSQPSYYVSESSGYLIVPLLLRKGELTSDNTLTIISSNQSPLSAEGKSCILLYNNQVVNIDLSGNGVDYSSIPTTAIFSAETNSTTINITVISDDIVEGTEIFELKIEEPPSKSDLVLRRQNTAIIHINDSTG